MPYNDLVHLSFRCMGEGVRPNNRCGAVFGAQMMTPGEVCQGVSENS